MKISYKAVRKQGFTREHNIQIIVLLSFGKAFTYSSALYQNSIFYQSTNGIKQIWSLMFQTCHFNLLTANIEKIKKSAKYVHILFVNYLCITSDMLSFTNIINRDNILKIDYILGIFLNIRGENCEQYQMQRCINGYGGAFC